MPEAFDLPLTGERTLPGIWHENYWFRRHEAVYRRVLAYAHAGRVLDAGSGEGYGANLLATVAKTVTALDYDVASVAHAAARYPDVAIVRGNLVQLPFANDSFDVVVSLQTIEHLWDQPGFVAECARVVKPSGLITISTPNRHTFPPGNVCHFRELDADELRELLGTHLQVIELLGLRHAERLRRWEEDRGALAYAQLAAEPDQWDAELSSLVRSVEVDDFEWHTDALDTTLDLIAICGRRVLNDVVG